MNIFVCISLTSQQRQRLSTAFPEHQLCIYQDSDESEKARYEFANCEVAFGNPSADWLAPSSNLKWIQLESVGFGEYTHLDWSTLGNRLQMTNLAGFFAQPVAESILAGVLAHYRGIVQLVHLQAEHKWAGSDLRPKLKTLQGAHVTLLGKGEINRRVEKLFVPFDCNITRFGRDWTESALDQALSVADIVICTVPETPLTRKLFNRSRLNKVKAGCLFVNSGRGSLVDEEALFDAAETGILSGAVIDVTQEEPLPSGHPFWTCSRILLTQHTGGGTADEIDRKIEVFIANFERYKNELPLHSLVDFKRGY